MVSRCSQSYRTLSFEEILARSIIYKWHWRGVMLIRVGGPGPPALPRAPSLTFVHAGPQIIPQGPPWNTRGPWKAVCKLLLWLEGKYGEIRKCHLSPSFSLMSFMGQTNSEILNLANHENLTMASSEQCAFRPNSSDCGPRVLKLHCTKDLEWH